MSRFVCRSCYFFNEANKKPQGILKSHHELTWAIMLLLNTNVQLYYAIWPSMKFESSK